MKQKKGIIHIHIKTKSPRLRAKIDIYLFFVKKSTKKKGIRRKQRNFSV